MGINYIDLNNSNLDKDFEDLDTIILSSSWLGILNLKSVNHLENYK